MTQRLNPLGDSKPTMSPSSEREATGNYAAQGSRAGETDHPDDDGLPDLSRLGLGDSNGRREDHSREQGGRAIPDLGARITPGSTVHITVNAPAHGAPVTVNLFPTFTSEVAPGGGDRNARRTRPAWVAFPATSPARIRLGGTTTPQNAVVGAPQGVAPAGNTGLAAASAPISPTIPNIAVPLAPPTGAHGAGGGPGLVGSGSPTVHTAPLPPTHTPQGAVPTQPPSPTLESVPTTPDASPALTAAELSWEDEYEYIAPRDPTHTRWYVITAGHRVGIWREWLDMSAYVTRVPGNRHKACNTRAEAEAHYYAAKARGEVVVIMP